MSDEIDQIEVTLGDLKNVVSRRDAAIRLSRNPDFKKVILEGYVKDEAVRLTALIGEEGFDQEGVQECLRGVAQLQRYIRRIESEGDIAEKSILDHEEALNDLRQESTNEQEV